MTETPEVVVSFRIKRRKDAQKKWRKDHAAHIRAYHQRWCKTNHKHLLAYAKRRLSKPSERLKNRLRCRAYDRSVAGQLSLQRRGLRYRRKKKLRQQLVTLLRLRMQNNGTH